MKESFDTIKTAREDGEIKAEAVEKALKIVHTIALSDKLLTPEKLGNIREFIEEVVIREKNLANIWNAAYRAAVMGFERANLNTDKNLKALHREFHVNQPKLIRVSDEQPKEDRRS